MAERKGNKTRLCINLSLFTLTDNNSSSNKSPKKFEDPNGAVVGLGIVEAMHKESNSRAAIIAISPRSTTSNPIPIFASFKKKPSIEEMEMCEEYTCVISHVGTNLVKKREYFDGQFIGNTNFNAYQKTVNHTTSFTMADFLNSCFLCKKQLKGLDIFMYSIDLSSSDSPKLLLHPCRILQRCTTFGGSDRHPSTFLKSPSNIEGRRRFVVQSVVAHRYQSMNTKRNVVLEL